MGGKCLEMLPKQGFVWRGKTSDAGLRGEQTRSPTQEDWRGFSSLGAGIKDFPYPRCAGFLHSPVALCDFNPLSLSCSLAEHPFILDAQEGDETLIPQGKFLTLSSVVHHQVREAFACALAWSP